MGLTKFLSLLAISHLLTFPGNPGWIPAMDIHQSHRGLISIKNSVSFLGFRLHQCLPPPQQLERNPEIHLTSSFSLFKSNLPWSKKHCSDVYAKVRLNLCHDESVTWVIWVLHQVYGCRGSGDVLLLFTVSPGLSGTTLGPRQNCETSKMSQNVHDITNVLSR